MQNAKEISGLISVPACHQHIVKGIRSTPYAFLLWCSGPSLLHWQTLCQNFLLSLQSNGGTNQYEIIIWEELIYNQLFILYRSGFCYIKVVFIVLAFSLIFASYLVAPLRTKFPKWYLLACQVITVDYTKASKFILQSRFIAPAGPDNV
jgi:hypothetical protein